METLKNIHPGEILLEEFMLPNQVSAYRLAKEIYIPQTRISEITKGRRRIPLIQQFVLQNILVLQLSFG